MLTANLHDVREVPKEANTHGAVEDKGEGEGLSHTAAGVDNPIPLGNDRRLRPVKDRGVFSLFQTAFRRPEIQTLCIGFLEDLNQPDI